jgi:hypothetical protein
LQFPLSGYSSLTPDSAITFSYFFTSAAMQLSSPAGVLPVASKPSAQAFARRCLPQASANRRADFIDNITRGASGLPRRQSCRGNGRREASPRP